MEADSGSFALTPEGRRIKVTLGVEGNANFSPNVATDANRSMLLPAPPARQLPDPVSRTIFDP